MIFSQDKIKISDSPDFRLTQMSKNQMRKTYLVTYRGPDLELFPTSASFGNAIAEVSNKGTGKVKVQYFAATLENHNNGGKHYHLAIKLEGPKR